MAPQVFLKDRTNTKIRSSLAIFGQRGGVRSPIRCLFLTLAVLFSFESASDSWAQTYRGKVLDAETGQPLEGAVVVIAWSKKPRIRMNGPEYFHSAKEGLTDARGEFSVDGSPGIDWNPFTYVVDNPAIAIYMPGYGPYPVGHVKETPLDVIEKAMTGAGAVIKLPKLKTQQEMRQYTSPGTLRILSDTPHEAIPNLMRVISIHRKLAGLTS